MFELFSRFDVRATDKNFDYMYATASVKVLVKDKNNHKPEFSQLSYWTSVSINTGAGQSVLTVEAKDDDFDKNAIITYSLKSTAGSSRFDKNINFFMGLSILFRNCYTCWPLNETETKNKN